MVVPQALIQSVVLLRWPTTIGGFVPSKTIFGRKVARSSLEKARGV